MKLAVPTEGFLLRLVDPRRDAHHAGHGDGDVPSHVAPHGAAPQRGSATELQRGAEEAAS